MSWLMLRLKWGVCDFLSGLVCVLRFGRTGLCTWCCPVCPGSVRSFTRRRMLRWTVFSARSKATSSKMSASSVCYLAHMSQLLSDSYFSLLLFLLTFLLFVISMSSFLMSHFCIISRGRVKTHVPMLQVWTAEKPHPQEEVRDGWKNHFLHFQWHCRSASWL